jgi:GTPase SAR1 family protein
MDDVIKYTDSNPIQIIIGNKSDLINERQVDENDIKILSQETGLNVIETSAKNSIKINDAIELLTRKLIQNKIRNGNNENYNTPNGVNLKDLKEGNDNNGCNFCG